MRYFWTCCKCYGNEYSEGARINHICNSHLLKKEKEKKKEIEVAEIIEEKPQELTKKKGVKSGRKSKKTTNKSD